MESDRVALEAGREFRAVRLEGTPTVGGERIDLRDDDLHDVLTAFYAAVAEDPVLAPYFANLDMADHMPRIVAFWSTMLFHTGRFSGNAFEPLGGTQNRPRRSGRFPFDDRS